MVSEYKTLKDAPLNECIDVDWNHFGNRAWVRCSVKYKGEERSFISIESRGEYAAHNEIEWRYPIDPLEELENKLLDKWRSQGVDYAMDEFKHIPHRWILQELIDAGADVDAI